VGCSTTTTGSGIAVGRKIRVAYSKKKYILNKSFSLLQLTHQQVHKFPVSPERMKVLSTARKLRMQCFEMHKR